MDTASNFFRYDNQSGSGDSTTWFLPASTTLSSGHLNFSLDPITVRHRESVVAKIFLLSCVSSLTQTPTYVSDANTSITWVSRPLLTLFFTLPFAPRCNPHLSAPYCRPLGPCLALFFTGWAGHPCFYTHVSCRICCLKY